MQPQRGNADFRPESELKPVGKRVEALTKTAAASTSFKKPLRGGIIFSDDCLRMSAAVLMNELDRLARPPTTLMARIIVQKFRVVVLRFREPDALA